MCQFRGDECEIDPMEWLRMEEKNDTINFMERFYFYDEFQEWWMSFDEDTKLNSTWEEFEKIFSN
jgi:hypothetical protein